MRKLTDKEYKEKLKLQHGGKIKALDVYVNMTTKIRHKCKNCNHIWITVPDSIITRNTGCPACNGGSGLNKKTQKQYEAEIKLLSKGSVIVLEKYINNATKIKHRCLNCNKIYSCTPSRVTCVDCRNKNFTKTSKEYDIKLKEATKGDIIALEKYIGSHVKIEHYCNNCEHTWKPYPTHILQGTGCPKCCTRGSPFREYFLGNRKVYVQGYESIVLDWLCKTLQPNSINVFSEGNVPKITYNKTKKHHPDIYIKENNTLIEVKGLATLGLIKYHNTKTEQCRIKLFKSIQAKAKAALKLGYNYKLVLVLSNKQIIELPDGWEKLSYAFIREFYLSAKQ